MTLNKVVLPAPLGPIRPVIWPCNAVSETSTRAVTPPNLTATSRTSSTASDDGAAPASGASASGVDKARLLFEEDRGRAGRLRRQVGHRVAVAVRTQPLGDRCDP